MTAVTLVSTHTLDVFTDDDGAQWSVPGGPARYVTEAFQHLGLECSLITGEVATSFVIKTNHGEEYLINSIEPIRLPTHIESAAVVLSPIVQEIDPADVPTVSGRLVVDLQGFVREPGISSACVSAHFNLTQLLERADVVKASEAELNRLTASSRQALRACVVLTTLGEVGVRVRVDGRETLVPAERVQSAHTIGAGDTFLAAFTAALLGNEDPVRAATSAARFTEAMLRRRG